MITETQKLSNQEENNYQHDSAVKEAKWRALIDEVSDAVIIINDTGIIQETNPATLNLFGYAPDELVNQNISILMPEPYRGRHDEYLKRYLETGEKHIIGTRREVAAIHKNGNIFPIVIAVSEARYDGVRLFVGIIHDLRESKVREEKLFQTQKYEAIAQLTAGIAHDFNNLLTVVQGNLEMLDGHVSSDTGHEVLAEVLDAIDDGSHLIKQLLAFGRKQVLKPDVVNINELVRDTLRLLRRTITETIEIQDALARNLPLVKVDPIQLENALMNLVINARDAITESGQILIKTSRISVADSPANFPIDSPHNLYVCISVQDNGSGMSKEVLDHAFEPFFSTKNSADGSGLGLSMVQGFIKQSGGEISIESELHQGTIVSLYLPCLDDNDTVSSQTSSGSKEYESGNGELILLVEDDVRVRRVNSQRLEKMGYKVLQAENGKKALEVLSANTAVDLLFSDIVLPGTNSGHELADQACRLLPKLKVLLTTGYDEESVISSLPSYKVLTKPYSIEQLAKYLREVLDEQ